MTGRSSAVAGRSPTRAPRNPAVQACGNHLADRVEQTAHASHRRPLVESGVLDRRPHQQRPVLPRHEIATAGPGDAAKRRAGPAQVEELAADGTDRQRRADAVDRDVTGPAAGAEHDGVAGQRSAIRLDDDVAVVAGDATHAAALDQLRTAAARGGGERPRQLRRRHEAVRLDQQAAERAVAELRLLGTHRLPRPASAPARRVARGRRRSPAAPAVRPR